MINSRFYRTEAIVLKYVPIGDADRVLTCFTPEIGKFQAVARGARKTKSKLGGHVEILNCVRLSIAKGKNLDVVTQADSIYGFRRIKEDLSRLSCALYMADLVNNFSVAQLPNVAIYKLLRDSLIHLNSQSGYSLLLRYFETKLLFHSGSQPELFNCINCQTKLTPNNHLFAVHLGGILCPDCRVSSSSNNIFVSLGSLNILRHLQRDNYSEIENFQVSKEHSTETENILRKYINYLLEREIKSVAFMKLVTVES